MSVSATGAAPAARPGASGRPAAARRLLLRWLLPLLVSGAILVYLFAAQGVDPWALVPLVQAISLPGCNPLSTKICTSGGSFGWSSTASTKCATKKCRQPFE